MTMPQGIHNPDNKVCLLKKSLYGFKQASRKWHEKLVIELNTLSFIQSKNDYSLFIKNQNNIITIMAVYVDDILLATRFSQSSMLNLELNNSYNNLHTTQV